MKVATCHSVNLAIEEAELGWQPDGLVSEHLSGCPSCQKLYEERTKLRQLVNSIGTVAAPADFDFRLRARLANEKRASHREFSFAGLSFGLPSVTVASLIMIVGGFLIFRTLSTETHQPAVAVKPPQVETETRSKDQSLEDKKTIAATQTPEKAAPVVNTARKAQVRVGLATAAVTKRASKDLGSSVAPVVKRNEQVADAGTIFPIDASSESLKLSLDDGSGVSRTISLPRVSFGSERVMTGDHFSKVKTSAKGIW